MPMRIWPLLTRAPTRLALLCCSRGRRARGDEVLNRLPTAVTIFFEYREIATGAGDGLVGRLVGHRQGVMAPARREVTRFGDEDPVGPESQREIGIIGQAPDGLAPVGLRGRERIPGTGDRGIVGILAGERIDVLGCIILLPLRFLRLEIVGDLRGGGIMMALPAVMVAAG